MDRVSLVKIVTPNPEAIEHFLTNVVDIPEGWHIGGYPQAGQVPHDIASPARNADGSFDVDSVNRFRGDDATSGIIVGSPETRQFQVLHGEKAHIRAAAIGTRNLEDAHAKCVAAGYPCTPQSATPWGDSTMEYFYCEVGGIVFEVLRAKRSE